MELRQEFSRGQKTQKAQPSKNPLHLVGILLCSCCSFHCISLILQMKKKWKCTRRTKKKEKLLKTRAQVKLSYPTAWLRQFPSFCNLCLLLCSATIFLTSHMLPLPALMMLFNSYSKLVTDGHNKKFTDVFLRFQFTLKKLKYFLRIWISMNFLESTIE